VLSIATKISVEYYSKLAREDYYEAGGEPPGRWYGAGAEALGFEVGSEVEQWDFLALAKGYSPEGEKLVRNAGKDGRRPGFDLTFSAPKSVSAVWAVSDFETRKAIEEAFQESVAAALKRAEEVAGWSRTGAGGAEYIKSDLVFSVYQHGTSRAQEPNLHLHAVALNIGVGDDGRTRTIDPSFLLENKMYLGAYQRNELANKLGELGFEIRRDGWKVELAGVPEELTNKWSSRRKAVEEWLLKNGWGSSRAASVGVLETRDLKQEKARAELLPKWEEEAREIGFTREKVAELRRGRELSPGERELGLEKALSQTLKEVERRQSYFTKREFNQEILVRVAGLGVSSVDVERRANAYLLESELVKTIGQQDMTISVPGARGQHSSPTRYKRTAVKELFFATKDNLRREAEIVRSAETSLQKQFQPVYPMVLESAKEIRTLSEEQERALDYITSGKGRVQTVVGNAGTGKSYMLGAAREVWAASEYKVYGAALSGQAAKNLELESKIESRTIFATLRDLKAGRLQFDSKSVLVIDEAAMVSNRDMHELVRETEGVGAKLVLVGDHKQLQAIEAGGVFKRLQELQSVEIREIRRQREGWQRGASLDFAEGRARDGLKAYAERGFVHVEESRRGAKERLIDDWAKFEPKDSFIVTGTRREVAELNVLAQEVRQEQGKLGDKGLGIEREQYFVGDRVRFTRGSRIYGVKNHTRGTVIGIDEGKGRLQVELDSGKKIAFSGAEFSHVTLGYAGTTHSLQGGTAERTYALCGGSMQDRELSYVQFTRHKGELQIYTDRLHAGDELSDLSRSMERSRQKELAVSKEEELRAKPFVLTGDRAAELIDLEVLQPLYKRQEELAERSRGLGVKRLASGDFGIEELSKDKARARAWDEIGGKEFVSDFERVQELDKKLESLDKQLERAYPGMLKQYLPKHSRELRELEEERSRVLSSHNKAAKSYNDRLEVLNTPKMQEQIGDCAQELLSQNQKAKEELSRVRELRSEVRKEIQEVGKRISNTRVLANQQIELVRRGNSIEFVNDKKVALQVKQEKERELKISRSRGGPTLGF